MVDSIAIDSYILFTDGLEVLGSSYIIWTIDVKTQRIYNIFEVLGSSNLVWTIDVKHKEHIT